MKGLNLPAPPAPLWWRVIKPVSASSCEISQLLTIQNKKGTYRGTLSEWHGHQGNGQELSKVRQLHDELIYEGI